MHNLDNMDERLIGSDLSLATMEETDQATGLRNLVGKTTNPANEEAFVSTTSTGVPVEMRNAKKTRVISVTSGKGGVGKTSFSVNLALSLAKSGQKVLLFDADLGLANINVLIGIIPKFNLYHVVKGTKSLADVIISTPEGLDVIAGASGYTMLANLSGEDRQKVLKEFETLKKYDVMIIDTGAGVGANVLGFINPADEVLVVTTPEPTAITDAYGIIKSIVLQNPEKAIRLVVNRVHSALEAKKVVERVVNISNQFLNVRVDDGGFIYDDENVSKSVRRQKPFVIQYPQSKASSCVNVIASNLVHEKGAHAGLKPGGGLGSFFRKLFATEA